MLARTQFFRSTRSFFSRHLGKHMVARSSSCFLFPLQFLQAYEKKNTNYFRS